MNSSKRTSWPWILSLSWVLFVYTVFFLRVRIPGGLSFFTPSALPPTVSGGPFHWLSFLPPLGAAALVFGILWSLGKRLRGWFSLPAPGPMGLCLDLGFGIAALNLLWMGLGLARLWSEPLWLSGFSALALLLLKDLLELKRSGISWKRPDFPAWALLLAGAHLCFLLPHALLPETFYDSLNYFLGMPAFWLFHHGIVDEPGHILSGYFHGGSLFFLNGFVLAGTEGAKALGVLCFAAILLSVYAWGRELAGTWAGAAGAAAVSCFPLLLINVLDVRVDALLCFLSLLCTYCLFRALGDGKSGWLAAFALLCGCALSIKPTAVILALSAVLAFLWTRGGRGIPLARMAVLSGIQVIPWLLKNLSFTGNPFYPYAVSWWGGRSFPLSAQERLLHENQRFLPMDQGFLSVIDLPWRLTMPGAGDDQFLGPLLLAFLPLLFLLPSPGASTTFLRRTLALSLVGSLCLSHMLRFSLPAFLLALVLVPAVLSRAGKAWRGLFTGALALGALLLGGNLLHLSKVNFDGMGFWMGKEDRGGYLKRRLENSYYGAAEWIGGNLPEDSRLLLVGDSRGVYLSRPFLAQSVFDEPFFAAAARQEASPEGILSRLRKAGITHLAVNLAEGYRNSAEYRQFELSKAEWGRINRFVAGHLRLLKSEGPVLVYKIDPGGQPSRGGSNPFSYFCPQARFFALALEKGDREGARRQLSLLLDLFPGEPHWLQRKAALEARP